MRKIFPVSFFMAGCLLAANIEAQTAGCTDFAITDFKKVPLVTGIDSPIKMTFAKDGRLFYLERSGTVRLLKPGTTTPSQVLKLTVPDGTNNENGLLGIALDPAFDSDHWIYLYYTPATEMAYRVSRFTLNGDVLDATSEKILLKIPSLYASNSEQIIHAAGSMNFDSQGNLLVTTGDLTTSHSSNGYSPIDERPNNAFNDAQRTAANTNSLFGKILRITPTPDGAYTIPAGNLYPPGTAKTKPEILAMGLRNPFTQTYDPKTGWIYIGDVGADARADDPLRGPNSQDEVHQVKTPGNLGWPYVTGDNTPYNKFDFATNQSGPKFDPNALVNNSPNNTGLNTLPAAQKALFWYTNNGSDKFPGFAPTHGNRCIKIGGFYHYHPEGTNPKRLPPYFDNGFFMANHDDQEPLRFFKLDDAGNITTVKTVVSQAARPIASEISPDGSLYLMEWGSDNGHWFNGKNGIISRIEYQGSCSTTSIGNAFAAVSKEKKWRLFLGEGSGRAAELLLPNGSTGFDLFDVKGNRVASRRVAADSDRRLRIASDEFANAIQAHGLMLVKYFYD